MRTISIDRSSRQGGSGSGPDKLVVDEPDLGSDLNMMNGANDLGVRTRVIVLKQNPVGNQLDTQFTEITR